MTTMAALDNTDTVSSTGPTLARLAELQLLPSRILHKSRYPQFDADQAWRTLLNTSTDPAPVHRHWSQEIIHTLGIDTSAAITPRNATLPVVLLPTDTFETLGTWLGIQLCASRLRTIIQKSELQILMSLPHADVIKQARRQPAATHYAPARHWDAAHIAQNHSDLGHAALLYACCASDQTLHRLLALKLPETQPWPQLPDPDMLIHACLEFLTKADQT